MNNQISATKTYIPLLKTREGGEPAILRADMNGNNRADDSEPVMAQLGGDFWAPTGYVGDGLDRFNLGTIAFWNDQNAAQTEAENDAGGEKDSKIQLAELSLLEAAGSISPDGLAVSLGSEIIPAGKGNGLLIQHSQKLGPGEKPDRQAINEYMLNDDNWLVKTLTVKS